MVEKVGDCIANTGAGVSKAQHQLLQRCKMVRICLDIHVHILSFLGPKGQTRLISRYVCTYSKSLHMYHW